MKLFPKHGRMLLAVILVLLKISVLSVYGQNRTEYQSKWVENQLNLNPKYGLYRQGCHYRCDRYRD